MATNRLVVETAHRLGRRISSVRTLEPWLYVFYAGLCTLTAACSFFLARELQLRWSEAAKLALDPSVPLRQLPAVWWSAPLDDTFIHFDFARAFAEGRFFEWTAGGGYSSGATSWLYPVLLAVGIALGFDGQSLGIVADVIACVSVFACLWAARSLFRDLPRWVTYLLPVFVLTSGVLGWSLWSGMELALFLAIWATLAHCYVEERHAETASARSLARRGMAVAGLALVMTRPEALSCVGLFALFTVTRSSERRVQVWVQLVAPAVAFTALRALINLVLTGSYADAGAIVKLFTLRPFLEPREVALKWIDNIGFQFARITTYHTTDDALWGWQLWALLALAFVPSRTRSRVLLLALQALAWIILVGQNEYVRYQNDRYTMPAVFFLLVASTLGLGGALAQARQVLPRGGKWMVTGHAAVTALIAGTFIAHQFPRLNQQRWLFGRACRNIAEQQVRVGQLLRAGHFGATRRVLMGDAGAIPYFSGLPGVDAIGLGGTKGLPFAKAVNLGVGATVELVERMPPDERPDRLAIYPSWWDLLPVWFGRHLDEVRIRGNVICGAVDKVVYAAEWRGLEEVSRPALLEPNVPVLDELDFADVVSEAAHSYEITSKHSGYVVMKILPHLREPRRDLFDAGRLIFNDAKARFFLSGFRPGQPARLIFRAAPNYHMAFRVSVDGKTAGRVELDGGGAWQEPSIVLDPKRLRKTISVEITAETSEHILYHVWATGQ